jgi:serine/threonine protein kinase
LTTARSDLGRYKLGRVLGSGGMAIVYLADDRELGRAVAVKLLADNLAADDAFRARFLREAQLAAKLSHPHIVHVYDIGRDPGGRPFIVMEYVEGESLHQTLERERRLSPARVTAIAKDCCAGLAYAHAAGLVHRDLKPHNLLIDPEGHVKIADFGVARSLDGAGLTLTGSVLGTAGYLAPEQARGEPVTSAADIYGLGVTLHQLATGALPGPGAAADLPEPLRGAIARCLDHDPDRRPTATALAALLEESPGVWLQPDPARPAADATSAPTRAIADATSAPTRVTHRHHTPLDRRARYRLAAVLLGVLVVALIVILWATSGGNQSTPPAAHHTRQRSAETIPRAADPATQARMLAGWLRQRAG